MNNILINKKCNKCGQEKIIDNFLKSDKIDIKLSI